MLESAEQQKELAAASREIFELVHPPSRADGAEILSAVEVRTQWEQFAAQGITSVTAAEAYGGLGFATGEIALVLEEIGRAAVPGPIADAIGVVIPVLAAVGGAVADRWIEQVCTGEALPALRLEEAVSTSYGADADVVLLEQAGALYLVPRGAVTWRRVEGLDPSRRLAICERSLPAPEYALTADPAHIALTRTLGAAVTATVLNGVTSRMLEMSVGYVRERRQFGRPIGSFQAVKHLLADASLQLETARPVAWQALSEAPSGTPYSRVLASAAKVTANRAAAATSMTSLQVHGGIGFTWEYPLHHWLKRSRVLEEQAGSTRDHERFLGAALDDSSSVVAQFGPPPIATS